MRFLTPSEQALLDSLPETEATAVRALFETCDARLVDDPTFNYVYAWGNNSARAQMKGRRCRVIVWGGAMNTILVEFEDGTKLTTSRNAVRLVTGAGEGERYAEGPDRRELAPRPTPAPETSQDALFPMRQEDR